MRRVLSVLAVAIVLAACDVDFTEPATTPRPPGPGASHARLFARVHFEAREAPRFHFDAGLSPGVDADDAVRQVPDDTLRLGEVPLAPEAISPIGQRGYRWMPAPGILPDPMRLMPPPILGTIAPPPVPFRTYGRAGPDTLIITTGDTLRLDIATMGSESDLLQRTAWTLRLSGPDGTFTSRMDDTTPPPTFHIPTAWLEWSRGEEMTATLSVHEVSGFGPSDGDYELHLTVTSTVEWVVHWDDQPTS